MKKSALRNSKGAGVFEILFWIGLVAFVYWLVGQYRSHPDTLHSMNPTHSPLEDSK
jgi:hypothetical protein